MALDDNDAGSSPAPVDTDLAALSPVERNEWRMTGKLPDSTSPAESSPAAPVEQAASTDAIDQPVSETGAPSKGESRKEQLAAEIQDLLAKRHTARDEWSQFEQWKASRTQTPPAAPSPAPQASTAATFPDFATWAEKQPDGSYEQYLDERSDFRAEQRSQQQQAKERATAEQTTKATRAQGFSSRLKDAVTADPQFMSKLSPQIAGLVPLDALEPGQPMTPWNVIGQEILISPIGPVLMRHFSEHPEELTDLATLSPDGIVRRMGKLEARLETAQAPAVRPVKTVTDAPPPPQTLGRRPALPVDDAADAVARDDFRAFRDSANRREIAARGR